MPLPNATPPLQRVSNENSAPSVGGLPARGSSEPCRGLPLHFLAFLLSFARSLARSPPSSVWKFMVGGLSAQRSPMMS